MNEEEKNHTSIDKLAEKPQEATAHISANTEASEGATLSRFSQSARVTEAMMWHPPNAKTRQKPHNQGPYNGPTWGHLVRQIIVGVIETLIPLGFIVGMIYWRMPWLFWAVVHFLRGEPIFHF